VTHPPDPDRNAGAGDDVDEDISTGDPVEARFMVDTIGEDVAEPDDADDVATGIGGSRFSVDAQVGETVPPELDSGATGPVPHAAGEASGAPGDESEDESDADLDVELDPTDPGFTAADLAASSDEPAPVTSEFPAGPPPEPDEIDWDRLADRDYVTSSTSEYKGLAADLEAERHRETEQMAVSASMPGMESGVVGLEDVTGEPAHVEETAVPRATDLGIRVATGVGLMVLFLASLLWSPALAVLAIVVFGLAAGEFYAVLVRTGHHPVALVGLLGVLGCLIGAWVWGVTAIPVAITATVVAIGLFQGITPPRPEAMRDAALTVLGAAWIGGLGAFALPIITDDDYVWLIAAVVLVVVGLDVGQYFIGRRFGRRPLAPVVSPKKTVEGLVGGVVLAFVVAAALSLAPLFTLTDMLMVAGVAVVLGPLGDLSVSSIKRWIGVKDMGTVLPGHGGILDRIDALLFVIPAVWAVYRLTELVV
jgi:phosphatidate cytidylyltransferase